MFNQQEYINNFIKNTYKTVKLRIRNDDKILINKINSVDNINQYLIGLITKPFWNKIFGNQILSLVEISEKTHISFSFTLIKSVNAL